mgnify:CR=1 FL=1
MALVFDSLGYSRKLRNAGLEPKIAEAAADAAREYIMLELVSKADLQQAIDTQTLRLTVRLGSMIAVGIAILAAFLKLT